MNKEADNPLVGNNTMYCHEHKCLQSECSGKHTGIIENKKAEGLVEEADALPGCNDWSAVKYDYLKQAIDLYKSDNDRLEKKVDEFKVRMLDQDTHFKKWIERLEKERDSINRIVNRRLTIYRGNLEKHTGVSEDFDGTDRDHYKHQIAFCEEILKEIGGE